MRPWTTKDEMSFIDGLGSYTKSPVLTLRDRRDLLRAYKGAMLLRSNWAGIDQARVAAHVDNTIQSIDRTIGL